MNRQQAEHILDAYIQTVKFVDDEEPSAALREVILDAITNYKSSTITVPNITYSQIKPNYVEPRTVEDVLKDYWREACELPVDIPDEATAEAIDRLIVKYRAELRSMEAGE